MTYVTNVQPIYATHCGGCHGKTTGTPSGNSNFALSYDDTQKAPNANVASCAGIATVGACTLIRIKNGEMPRGAGCTGNPTTDAGNASCLTQKEQDTIAQWIADGEPKGP